jgi:hypothetical protein
LILVNRLEINNLLFISFFTIFFHLIPIGVETQPFLSVIIALLLFFSSNDSGFIFKKDVVFLYFLIFVLFAYSFYQLTFYYSFIPVLEFFKYLIGPIIFLALRKSTFVISYKIFKIIVYILLFFGLLNLILPSMYEFVFGNIIPRFKGNAPGGIRGITILTPEPSYFVVFQIILLTIIEKQLAYKNLSLLESKKLIYLKILVLLLSLFTKSAYVLILGLIFSLPSKINIKKLLKILLISFLLLLLLLNFFSENRLFQIVNLLYELVSEGDFDFISFLFKQESSGGTRLIVNFLAIFSIFINPFGSGLGSFSEMIDFYSNYYNMDISAHEVLGGDLLGKIYPQTYFANLCNDIGVFSLLLFPIIFLNNDNSNKSYNLKRNISLFALVFFQSQITNPAFWFLMAISKIPHDKKILK